MYQAWGSGCLEQPCACRVPNHSSDEGTGDLEGRPALRQTGVAVGCGILRVLGASSAFLKVVPAANLRQVVAAQGDCSSGVRLQPLHLMTGLKLRGRRSRCKLPFAQWWSAGLRSQPARCQVAASVSRVGYLSRHKPQSRSSMHKHQNIF